MEADMRHVSFGLSVVLFLVFAWAGQATAQETKSARGTVSAVGADSITVKAGSSEMKFMVDPKTVLTASGAGTASRQAEAAGKPGPRLADFLKAGDAVEVSYQESGGALRASNIRRVSSPGPGGGTTSEDRVETANGTVESISGSTLTITGSVAGGGTSRQSFSVDASTKVVAEGAGTAAAGKGGKVSITDFVGVGDQVTVSYRKAGAGLHADEVRVRSRKK
jgi:hypothetical protein